MPFTGVAPDVVAPATGSTRTPGRGVQMIMTPGTTCPSGEGAIVIFGDTDPFAGIPEQYDDFNIRSTTDIDLGFNVIPAGSAVVIDAAHVGRWKIALRCESFITTAPSAGSVGFLRQLFVNHDNLSGPLGEFVDDTVESIFANGPGLGSTFDVDGDQWIVSMWVDLAEDDVIWVEMDCFTSDGSPVTIGNGVLVMEWDAVA